VRRKKFPLFFACILFGQVCLSQNLELIQKLKQQLYTAKDEEQFNLLTDLAWEYRSSYPDSGIYFGAKAYALGQQLKIKKTLARPLNFIGIAYSHRGDNLNAFDYYNQALKVAGIHNDSLQLAHAYNNLGRLFFEQGMLPKSYDYLNKSLLLFKAIKDTSGLAYVYQSLASLYRIQKDFKHAEENYRKAYEIRLAIGNTREIMSALIQLGKLHLDYDLNDQALHYFRQADSTGNVIRDAINLAEVKTLIAETLMNKGLLPEAERIGREGLEYIKRSQNARMLPGAYLSMGRIQFKKGNFDEAIRYFTSALESSTQRKDLNSRMEAHFFLWQSFRQQNNPTRELVNHNQYLVLKDSIKTMEMLQREERFKFEQEIDKQQQENQLLKASQAEQKAIILALSVMSIAALFLLYLQWRHRNRIHRFNRRLEERNGEIKKINSLLNLKNSVLGGHITTLLELSKNRSISLGDLIQSAKDIVSVTAKNLKASRVSIWVYDSQEKSIHSMACYELASDSFLPSMKIRCIDAPAYFEAIGKDKMIVANNAHVHPGTKEFSESYLTPNAIYSLLDATFFLDGELRGLLCCEQTGQPRTWSAEDIIFASSVADIISLAFRTSDRLGYEKKIKQHSREIARLNEVLEERVQQRTEELEIRNRQLVEYAFINSHLLRGPLSRILGLINLMEHDKTMKQEEVIDLLRKSGDELDGVVTRITDTLSQEGHVTRNDIT